MDIQEMAMNTKYNLTIQEFGMIIDQENNRFVNEKISKYSKSILTNQAIQEENEGEPNEEDKLKEYIQIYNSYINVHKDYKSLFTSPIEFNKKRKFSEFEKSTSSTTKKKEKKYENPFKDTFKKKLDFN